MRIFLRALALGLVAAFAYFPCLHGTWLWDDGLEISQNAALRVDGGWWRTWIRPEGMDYFPLKNSLQWVEWHLWGADAAAYHWVNLGLHVLSALLLWRLLHGLGVRAAYLGGLLFAVHPLAVESVAWISEFKNTVSLPPLLLASIATVEFYRTGSRWAWVRSLLWFLAALACKTSVVMFPFVVLLYEWWRRGRVTSRDLRKAAPFFAASLAMGAATVWFQSTRAIGLAGTASPLGVRLAQAGVSLCWYARQAVWPSGLEPIYPSSQGMLPGCAAWLCVAVLLGLFWTYRAGWGRHALLGGGWFLINLLPVLGILPMAYTRISPRADHFAYLPLVGLIGLAAAAAGAAAAALGKRGVSRLPLRLASTSAAVAVVALLALETRSYAAVYLNEKALWTFAVERNPGAWLARNNLGKELLQEGRPADAAAQFGEATRIRPDSPEAHANLGNALVANGLEDEARKEYEAAIRIDPGFAGAHYNLGLSLLRAGRRPEAAAEFLEALKRDPRHAPARNSLGLALAGMGRLDEAREQYREALVLDPELKEAHLNLGNVLFRQGSFEEAVAEYRQALRIDPGYAGAHGNLGQALESLGRHAEAQGEFSEARRASNH